MEKEKIKQLYQTPEVGVYEAKIKAVICQSENLEEITRDNEAW